MLQYTVYAVMMPFFGMGGDHRADSWLGEPGTVVKAKFNGDDGTVSNVKLKIHYAMKFSTNIACDIVFYWEVIFHSYMTTTNLIL